jgi:hypothetical protein
MFRESKKVLKKTPGGYFSQLIQTISKSINTVSSNVAFEFQRELERQQSMLIWESHRVESTQTLGTHKGETLNNIKLGW